MTAHRSIVSEHLDVPESELDCIGNTYYFASGSLTEIQQAHLQQLFALHTPQEMTDVSRTLHEVVNQHTGFSLRMIDWLVTNYSKSHTVRIDGKNLLSSTSRRHNTTAFSTRFVGGSGSITSPKTAWPVRGALWRACERADAGKREALRVLDHRCTAELFRVCSAPQNHVVPGATWRGRRNKPVRLHPSGEAAEARKRHNVRQKKIVVRASADLLCG